MPRRPRPKLDEKNLTKGQLRKLTALKKSIGEDLGQRAFAEWLKTIGTEGAGPNDKNAMIITEALTPLIKQKGLRIPRGGYFLRRGRGRVIVERPTE
jgi:hypothetical protein